MVKNAAFLIGLGLLAAAAFGSEFTLNGVRSDARSDRYFGRFQDVVVRFDDSAVRLNTAGWSLQVAPMAPRARLRAWQNGDLLTYTDAWPGIDLQYLGRAGSFKSEYHLAPGADPGRIRLRYSGAGAAQIGRDGSLRIGPFTELPPYAYQEPGHTPVDVAYRRYGDGTIGFEVGKYDSSRELIIDPVMSYSTYFGGSGNTTVTSVAFDSSGNAIVAGWTTATDLPANGVRVRSGGGVDAFVAKLSATGNQVVWCTYLGGSGDDRAFGVAVDRSNNVYVTGWTQSANFPVVGALQVKLSGGRDAFVTKLNATGTAILYSTYLGGSNYDQGNAIAVDASGEAYVAGDTQSTNFPTLGAFQAAYGGQQDVFVAKLNAAGNGLLFSTYLGGRAIEHGTAIALDSSNHAYVTGSTYSSNFPLASATQGVIGGGEDAFVAELSATGNALVFSTYIGGSGGTPGLEECGNAVAVDGSGNLYVAGVTSSINFPTTAGAYQASLTSGGAEDHGFAWKVNSAKTQVIYSTYLAGTNMDQINAVVADAAGNAYLVGSTSSTNFPIVRPFQAAIVGLTNAFLLKLNATGSALIYGSYLGGSTSDTANGVAIDFRQNVLIGGVSSSGDFPVLNAAQSYSNAMLSGFVARIVPDWYPVTFQVLNGVGYWYLDTWRNGANLTIRTYSPAQASDVPIVGDWNGSGTAKIGIFRNGAWYLDMRGTGQIPSTPTFTWGQAGDRPLIGDWNGTGVLKAGLFRAGSYLLDISGGIGNSQTGTQLVLGKAFPFCMATDVPVVGDWAGSGVMNVGCFRSGWWYLDYSGDHQFGAGDWAFSYPAANLSGTTPVVGDWDGAGTVKYGVSEGGYWIVNISGTRTYTPGVDTAFYYGNAGFQFLVGH